MKSNNQNMREILEGIIQSHEDCDRRIADLKEEMAAIRDSINGVKQERKKMRQRAQAQGIELIAIDRILAERSLTPEERGYINSIHQVYQASLGMLDGTPLGEAARRRIEEARRKPSETHVEDERQDEMPGVGEPAEPLPAPITEKDIQAARKEGGKAARQGHGVTDNPYAFDDARRAAWDEGWCGETGSDGMDIPEAWRRKKKNDDDDKKEAA